MNKTTKLILIIFAVFAPFLLAVYALYISADPLVAIRSLSGIDWLWLILLGAMALGVFYWLFFIREEEEITEEFMDLDTDHDGYITRKEASKWKYLARVFDKFDTNHDGKLSRQEYEKAVKK